MGKIHWYLGFEVICNRTARSISINQQAYIESVLERFNLTDANPATLLSCSLRDEYSGFERLRW